MKLTPYQIYYYAVCDLLVDTNIIVDMLETNKIKDAGFTPEQCADGLRISNLFKTGNV